MKHLKILLLLLLCGCFSQKEYDKPYTINADNYPLIIEKVKWSDCYNTYDYKIKNMFNYISVRDSFGVGDTLRFTNGK